MTSRSAELVALLVFSSLACDDGGGFEQIGTIRAPIVGTPASMLRAATAPGVGSSLPGGFALPTDTGEEIAVVARGYQFTGDYLAIDGAARESGRSSFILKGDGQNIYGWLVLPDRDLAFEYTTSRQGNVIVQRVPITKIYPVCNDGPPEADALSFEAPTVAAGAGDPPHVGDYDGSDTNKLQSRPGATKVLFMDVSVLTLAKAELWRAWQIVSGAYSAFDVNVTTDAAVYEAADARNRGKACISNEDGRSSCSVNAFGTSRCCTVYNKGTGVYQGLTTSHELGHLMGLQHDGGGSGGEYFEGFSAFKWVPIMGDSTPKNSWGVQALFQWSKGEYTSATETQDDLAIITKNLPYREDDVADAKALIIATGGTVSSLDNRGQIARNTDTDTFTFAIASGGGRATLVIDRIEYFAGGYLDVDAQIHDASGTMIAQSNDKVARTAKFDVSLPAGEYRLIIKGGAEGTPQNGFSNYSSLGFYGISGTITGGVVGGAGGTGGAGGAGGAGGRGGGGGAGGTGGSAGSGGGGRGGASGTGGSGAGARGGTTGAGGSAGAGRGGSMGVGGSSGAGGGERGGTTGSGGTTGAAGTTGGGGVGGLAGVDGAARGGAGGPGIAMDAGAPGSGGAGASPGGAGGAGVPPVTADASSGPGAGLVQGGCACDVSTGRPSHLSGILAIVLLGLVCCIRRPRRRSI
jgi:hypothetical protein